MTTLYRVQENVRGTGIACVFLRPCVFQMVQSISFEYENLFRGYDRRGPFFAYLKHSDDAEQLDQFVVLRVFSFGGGIDGATREAVYTVRRRLII